MRYRFIPKNLNLGLTCIWRDVLKVPPKCRTRISKNVILANCTRCKFIHSLGSKRGENMALIGLGLHSCQAGMGIRWWWLWTSGRRAGCKMRARALGYVMLRDAGNWPIVLWSSRFRREANLRDNINLPPELYLHKNQVGMQQTFYPKMEF